VKALEHYIAIKSANKLRASTAAQYKRQINHSRPDGIYDAQMIGTFPNYYELFHGALINEILE
jgi:hypothetical protein